MRRFALSGVLLLALAACDDEGTTELSTTSSLIASPTSASVEEGTTTSADGGDEPATSTTLRGEPVADFEIVARQSDASGETLYIVIPPAAYTDVDIENFILGLVDDETVTFGAEIFDDPGAVDAFRKSEEERTEGETQLIEEHHFASVQNGNRVVFRGPFASSGDFLIGS